MSPIQYMSATRSARIQSAGAAAAIFALALLATAGRLGADDRDFVRKSVEDPYVFIILDTSGSMNWTTRCTAAQLAAGDCRQRCDSVDCFTPLNADDPASKFYQAKEALYAVLAQVDNINFGFATYNQDGLNVASKHWVYKVTSPGIALQDGTIYPAVDTTPGTAQQCSTTSATASCDVFGRIWPCTQDSNVGCWPGGPNNTFTPARLSNAWEKQRVRRLSKLGDANNQNAVFYIQSSGVNYEVKYNAIAGPDLATAATLDVSVGIKRCTGSRPNTCTITQGSGAVNVSFARVEEFLSWDNGAETDETQGGWFGQGNFSATPITHYAADTVAGDTCAGWDPNAWTAPAGTYEPVADDPYLGVYNLRFPTDPSSLSDTRGKWFFRGDVLPLDWRDDNRADVLQRLAPTAGVYDQAPYFNDHPNAGETFLRLRDPDNRPLLASGGTPLGASIQSFRTWYAGCPQGNCPKNSGWKEVATAQDPNWGCRKKYLLVLTDGDESCGGGNSACNGTASLRAQESIFTYVVAFGVQGGGNTLTCMAANGGTGDPIFPQNKQELIDALTKIFTEVKEEARAFASAAVPSVEANVKDTIILSDFTPLTDESIWDGHLDAFLKPLPTLPDGTPDDRSSAACPLGATANCHLWDAGDKLTLQAPDLASPIPPNLNRSDLFLGLQPDKRRVYYTGVGGTLRLFEPPTDDTVWLDLFAGLGFKDGATLAANKTRGNEIIGQTLTKKRATITLPSGGTQEITFVMGDVFHSDPLIMESPHDITHFDAATEPALGDCRLTSGALAGKGSSSNYRCFASKQQYRRKLLLVGANDAQLHAFNAGTFDTQTDLFKIDNTGGEAFAIIPRMALPIVRDQAEGKQHIFGVDGPVVSGDVFFASAQGGDDQWHTMAVAAMREGGRKLTGGLVFSPEVGDADAEPARVGFFALDITQPDPLKEELDSRTGRLRRFVPETSGPVPGCAALEPQSGAAPPPDLDAKCDRRFPSLLWEFTDLSPTTGEPLDENLNGDGDLGAPWSKPILTRVKLAGGEVRPVVVVGGGLDPENGTDPDPDFGNFVYILDARTGEAIYKREVEGSVPAVAVLDSDQDNIADFLYFGTTAGRVYKVNLKAQTPTLSSMTVRDRKGVAVTLPERVQPGDWDPFIVFQTGDPTVVPEPERLAIFEEIQLLAVNKLGRYALAFGTGWRENLWNFDGTAGRFYVIVDDAWITATGFTEANYKRILPDDPDLTGAGANPLFAPTGADKKGWYLFLDPNERVITKAFGVSGVLIFSSFQPHVFQEGTTADPQCVRTGDSRNFVVFTTSGNAVTSLSGTATPERYIPISDFLTSPFVEQVQTQNITGGAPPPPTDFEADCTNNPRLRAVANVLKGNGPSNAQYGNYFLRLGQRESKRGVFYPACVPIAIIDRNWKEN